MSVLLTRMLVVVVVATLGLILIGCPAQESGSITIEVPQANEVWFQGSVQTIRWTASGSGDVEIHLYQGDRIVSPVEVGVPDRGTYQWEIPTDLAPASNYQIYIKQESVQSLSVPFTVAAAAVELAVSELAHNFGLIDVDDAGERQWTFEVWNSGTDGLTLDFQAVADKDWLSLNPPSGTSLGSNDKAVVTVSLSPSLLSVGKNTGRITVSVAGLPPKTLNITAMRPLTGLGLDLVSIHDFGARESQWSFNVWNDGDPETNLAFTVFADKAWVMLDPSSGTSTDASDVTSVTVTIDREALPAVANSAIITIASEGLSPERITVTATKAIPATSISSTAHDFGSDAIDWSFDVWNSGNPEATLDFQVFTDREWVSLTPESGSSTNGEDRQTIAVTVDRSALSGGVNTANITVSASSLPPQTIRLTATRAKPALAISSSAFDFGEDTSQWSFDLWNSGDPDATLEFIVFADKDWIALEPASGSSTGFADKQTVSVTIDRTLLVPGDNRGTVTVSAAEGVAPQTIAISAVEPEPAVMTSAAFFNFSTATSEWAFEVWGGGDPAVTHSFTIAPDQDWISVEPASVTSTGNDEHQTVNVSIDRSLLAPGENEGSITITAEGLVPRSVQISATMAQASIDVSATAFDFGGGGTSWTFEVWNGGDDGTTLEFLASADKEWIDIDSASGTSADADERVTITVTVDRNAVEVGAHTGTITLRADGLDPQEVGLAMTKTQPAIGLSLVAVHDFGSVDTQWTFEVWNDGAADSVMEFSVFPDKAWVRTTPETASSTGADDPKVITVTVDRGLLPAGTHTAMITVSSEGLVSRTVRVTATKAQPKISVSSTSFDFSTLVAAWSFDVWNSGDPGSVLEFEASTDVEWLTLEPASAASADDEDRKTIAVTINRALLPLASNNATITIRADGVAPKAIPVRATRSQAAISVSGPSYDFGLTDTTWSFDVWNSGASGSTLDFVVAPNAEWFACTPLAGTSTDPDDPQTIVVTVNRALLAGGANHGAITITSDDLPPKTVTITATQPQPAFTVSGSSFDFGYVSTTWTFDVWSSGDPGTTLDFIISADQEWLSFSPASGTSTGPDDRTTVTVTVDRDALVNANSSGTISVFSSTTTAQKLISVVARLPQPSIALSGTSFDFGLTQATGEFDVWNAGHENTSLVFAWSSDKAWLSAALDAGSTNTSAGPDDIQTVIVSIDRGQMDLVRDTGHLTISADGIASKTVSVAASRTGPALAASSSSFDFEFFGTAWSFDVWNDGPLGSSVDFIVAVNKEWITLTPTKGTSTGPDDAQTISVTLDRNSLPDGVNTATVTIATAEAGIRTVSLRAATPQPAIGLSATSFDFEKDEITWSFDVWNLGHTGTVLDFTCVPEKDWLTCTPAASTSTDPADKQTITVTIDRAKLSVGSNTARVFINSSLIASKAVIVSASTPVPKIALSSTAHDFAPTESVWAFDVWNTGDAGTTLEFDVAADQTWIDLTPPTGSSTDSSDLATITVTIDRLAIPNGTSTGRIFVIDRIGPVLAISLRVFKPEPDIETSAFTHDFGATTTTWAFDVWNAGDAGTTLDFQVADDQLWIDVSPTSGSSTGPADRATINVTIDRAILSADTNRGNIYISSLDITTRATVSVLASLTKKALFVSRTPGNPKSAESNPDQFDSIQDAIDAAAKAGIAEVWVAEGIYTETVTMRSGVSLYGGFPANADLSQAKPDPKAYPTIIDGEGLRRCVTGADGATLQGFVLQRGHAELGGGLFVSDASMDVRDCVFEQNTARFGGAVYCENSHLSLEQCTVTRNALREDGDGGGVYAVNASVIIHESNLADNASPSLLADEESDVRVTGSEVDGNLITGAP